MDWIDLESLRPSVRRAGKCLAGVSLFSALVTESLAGTHSCWGLLSWSPAILAGVEMSVRAAPAPALWSTWKTGYLVAGAIGLVRVGCAAYGASQTGALVISAATLAAGYGWGKRLLGR